MKTTYLKNTYICIYFDENFLHILYTTNPFPYTDFFFFSAIYIILKNCQYIIKSFD